MKKRYMYLLFVLLFVLSSSISFAAEKVYTMEKICATQPMIKITKIVTSKEETKITIVFENTTDSKTWARIYPPGHAMAFYITDVKNTNKYYLLDSENIAIAPTKTDIYPGTSLEFTLIFEAIPTTMKNFHLVEGTLPSERMNTWYFSNIKLQ